MTDTPPAGPDEDRAVLVRPASSHRDLAAMASIDLSYTTDRVYRVQRSGLALTLAEERVDPPAERTYPRPVLELTGNLLAAWVAGQLVGYGELRFEAWNSRARIEHLYVARSFRGHGAGRSLLTSLSGRARELSARCLWLETQNVNYPAIQFYLRMGFQLCGLDETLYRPGDAGIQPGDVALYFTRSVAAAPVSSASIA